MFSLGQILPLEGFQLCLVKVFLVEGFLAQAWL